MAVGCAPSPGRGSLAEGAGCPLVAAQAQDEVVSPNRPPCSHGHAAGLRPPPVVPAHVPAPPSPQRGSPRRRAQCSSDPVPTSASAPGLRHCWALLRSPQALGPHVPPSEPAVPTADTSTDFFPTRCCDCRRPRAGGDRLAPAHLQVPAVAFPGRRLRRKKGGGLLSLAS